MTFRERLLGTLRQLRPVLEEPGVLVVGSEVPNLLQPGALATLVVSRDVDVAIPVDRVDTVKRRSTSALPTPARRTCSTIRIFR